ncbi:hypothetical protein ADUPG1_008703 [Aduncisulcus paluster]|uniref:Uncharacterized protein n=1 Tax=Aduncisulcus paluster TaxID=2918883 RepID=A0ABQ5KSX3_9EUKA|nr:hypothetical protein ADUPG1_008703 [Aduncisulcus paluster]
MPETPPLSSPVFHLISSLYELIQKADAEREVLEAKRMERERAIQREQELEEQKKREQQQQPTNTFIDPIFGVQINVTEATTSELPVLSDPSSNPSAALPRTPPGGNKGDLGKPPFGGRKRVKRSSLRSGKTWSNFEPKDFIPPFSPDLLSSLFSLFSVLRDDISSTPTLSLSFPSILLPESSMSSLHTPSEVSQRDTARQKVVSKSVRVRETARKEGNLQRNLSNRDAGENPFTEEKDRTKPYVSDRWSRGQDGVIGEWEEEEEEETTEKHWEEEQDEEDHEQDEGEFEGEVERSSRFQNVEDGEGVAIDTEHFGDGVVGSEEEDGNVEALHIQDRSQSMEYEDYSPSSSVRSRSVEPPQLPQGGKGVTDRFGLPGLPFSIPSLDMCLAVDLRDKKTLHTARTFLNNKNIISFHNYCFKSCEEVNEFGGYEKLVDGIAMVETPPSEAISKAVSQRQGKIMIDSSIQTSSSASTGRKKDVEGEVDLDVLCNLTKLSGMYIRLEAEEREKILQSLSMPSSTSETKELLDQTICLQDESKEKENLLCLQSDYKTLKQLVTRGSKACQGVSQQIKKLQQEKERVSQSKEVGEMVELSTHLRMVAQSQVRSHFSSGSKVTQVAASGEGQGTEVQEEKEEQEEKDDHVPRPVFGGPCLEHILEYLRAPGFYEISVEELGDYLGVSGARVWGWKCVEGSTARVAGEMYVNNIVILPLS